MRGVLRFIRGVVIGGLIGAIGAAAIGFLVFAVTLPGADDPRPNRGADAVVVLTGGTGRLEAGLRLLSEGEGQRLLISGAHRDTTRADVVRGVVPVRREDLAGRIDLGYEALDTFGNAEEIRAWARRHGFRSLTVVTSTYHMTRAKAELRHQLPDVALIAYPVVSARVDTDRPFGSLATVQVLGEEYLKLVVGSLRRLLHPSGTVPAGAGARRETS